MSIVELPSPNYNHRNAPIDILLLHYTGMQSAQAALDRLCDPAAKVSAHYVVDEDGTHLSAGRGRVQGLACRCRLLGRARRTSTPHAIGIEIVNPGHEFGYRAFPMRQMESVLTLAKEIVDRHGIVPARVLGHSDVAPLRKEDPGELFDWHYLAESGVGLWPQPKPCSWSDAEFLLKLGAYGYDLEGPQGHRACQGAACGGHGLFPALRPARLTSVPDPELKAVLNGLIDLASAGA